MSKQVTVTFHRVLFKFASLRDWVNHARRRFEFCGVMTCDTVCVDTAGRVCSRGIHFARADKENTYPITVYAIDPPGDLVKEVAS